MHDSPSTSSPGTPPRRPPLRRWLGRALIASVVLVILAQAIPYGRAHENPPVTHPIAWNSPRTEALVRAACFDCHSNETVWPWYSNVAPVSWLVQSDVDEGREHLNFSTGHLEELDEIAEVVLEGEMPPWVYLPTHSEARLSAAEKQELIDGLRATFPGRIGSDGHDGHGEGHAHDDDD